MKTNLDKYVKEVVDGFQTNKGRASVYCFPPISFAELIVNLIDKFYIKSPGAQVFIVVDGFETRKAINARLNKNKGVEYNIKILSADYIKSNYKYNYKFIITVNVNDNFDLIEFLSKQTKFMLTILTKNIMNNDFIAGVRHLLPNIETTVSDISVRGDSIYSPVEEYRFGVELNDEDKELYNKYSEYISLCVSIFGDLSNIEKCRSGDSNLNISSAEFRDIVAKENGWSTELDTAIEWSKQIDDTYNPNVLLERANTFYTITKQRRDLVTDNFAKIKDIINICLEHKDEKILIVSKRGEFAATITKCINEYCKDTEHLKCGDYHDCIDNAIALDIYGEPILVKSGVNKGKPKVLGAQAISTRNEQLFNDNDINVLSIKNSSNVKLKIAVDRVIFTSPFIDDVIAFKTRFTNIVFNGTPTILYKVYCRGTIENKHLAKQKESSLVTIIDDTDNFVGYDENNGDVIL